MTFFASPILRTSLIAVGLTVGVSSFSPALAQTKPSVQETAAKNDKIIAKGTGFTVTEQDIIDAINDPALGAAEIPEDQKRETVIEYLINVKAISNAASQAKVDQSQDFIKRMNDYKQQLMTQTFLEQEIKKIVTPEAMRKLYDDGMKDMKPTPEVRARHILVETEDQARAVVARLKKGEDFAKVAAELSKDPGSKNNGGDLGFFSKDSMVAPFSEAAFKLEPNQTSEPVKSEFGWHVIRVEEKRERPVPSFDQLKPQIETHLARQAQETVIQNIRKQANVQRLDNPPQDKGTPAQAPTEAKEPAKK